MEVLRSLLRPPYIKVHSITSAEVARLKMAHKINCLLYGKAYPVCIVYQSVHKGIKASVLKLVLRNERQTIIMEKFRAKEASIGH